MGYYLWETYEERAAERTDTVTGNSVHLRVHNKHSNSVACADCCSRYEAKDVRVFL